MDATLRSIPLEFGFSPLDYERVTDAAIPKKANVLDADKMQNICLMNPAFNMNNKEFGRRLMLLQRATRPPGRCPVRQQERLTGC
jgi:hypothetical protein